MISATFLYDYVNCPHRVTLDLFGNPADQDDPNPFVELLWKQGIEHEADIVASLGISTNLRLVPVADRESETRAAMAHGSRLIYGGRLTHGDLVGEPDLLERRGRGYIPGDIKAGSGLEGEDGDGGNLKKTYAFQLAHYVHILEELGLGDGSREGYIIDRHASRVPYTLNEPQGTRNTQSWWAEYLKVLAEVRAIAAQASTTRGALAAVCKLCHWYSHCRREMVAKDDLTLIAELGRAKRDVMLGAIPTVQSFAACDPEAFIHGKKTDFPGVGPDSLRKFQERARLLASHGRPYLKGPVVLPVMEKEVYFDIETDPMADFVYLHGFVERRHGQPETASFKPFFADGCDALQEEEVFRKAWTYLSERVFDSTIYYYSKYERTAYKALAVKYPGVCSVADVEGLFGLPAMVDLYSDVVRKFTEWPTYDQSIKTLAVYLGFHWRDPHPSGAASIEWYRRWVETGDAAVKQRILDYNEDDCLATGVVADGIRRL